MKPRLSTFQKTIMGEGLIFDTTKKACACDMKGKCGCFGVTSARAETAFVLGTICQDLGVKSPKRFDDLTHHGWRAIFHVDDFCDSSVDERYPRDRDI